jgi:hypothetical protein
LITTGFCDEVVRVRREIELEERATFQKPRMGTRPGTGWNPELRGERAALKDGPCFSEVRLLRRREAAALF